MAENLETRTYEQLGRATIAEPEHLVGVQAPGGPMQALEIGRLLGRLGPVDMVVETAAELDLDHDEGALAIVYADPDREIIGYHVKSGASGMGEWVASRLFARKGDPGGNVMAVGRFDELADLVIPAGVDRIVTAAFDAAEPIGGAAYRVGAIGDPPAAESRFSTNSANLRPIRLDEQRRSLAYYGGRTSRADNSGAFADSIVDAVERGGGRIWLPEGGLRMGDGLALNLTGLEAAARSRVSIEGPGSGSCDLIFEPGVHEKSMIAITGGTWGSQAVNPRLRMGGFRMKGGYANPVADGGSGNKGIVLNKAIGVDFYDIELMEFTLATEMTDVVIAAFHFVRWNYNNYGVRARGGAGAPAAGSDPNEMLFTQCHWIANRQYANWFTKGGNLTFVGGSFEGNSMPGDYASDAARYSSRFEKMGVNAVSAVTMLGVHHEGNAGKADIWIEHDDRPCGYFIDRGTDFFRNGPANYADTHVLFETTGAAKALLVVDGVGFGSVNGYAGSAARRVVKTGAITGNLHEIVIGDNVYEDPTEKPLISGAQVKSMARAAALINFNGGDGSINQLYNVASLVKNATGIYTINFARAMKSALFTIATSAAAPVLVYKIGQSSSHVQVAVRDLANALVDVAEVQVIVFGGGERMA